MEPIKILIIATSHEQLGNTGRRTGVWLEELAAPYAVFKEAGALITLASIKGGEVPLDPKSESTIASNSTIRRFKKDPEAISWLSHAISIDALSADDYDLVFLCGGHGPMWDFPGNERLTELLKEFNRQDKLIGAVCHGVSGLIGMENELGEPWIKGRRITAFSNSEEQVSGLTDVVPFLLESALVSLGAFYSQARDFVSHIAADGNIITGQNPASSEAVAKKLLACLRELPVKAGAAVVLG